MTKTIRKSLAFLLAISIVLSMSVFAPAGLLNHAFLGMTAKAAEITQSEPKGDGSTENPYRISTAEELYWFSNCVNNGNTSVNAILVNDIFINKAVIENGKLNNESLTEWIPIGGIDETMQNLYMYSGTFDGQNHTISGLYNSNSVCAGLFGLIGETGRVFDLKVEDSYFNGSMFVAGVSGANTGTINNCSFNGIVNSDNSEAYVGGISGYNENEISNCYNISTVSGILDVGGICGSNNGNIINCYNTGEVSGPSNNGGICGTNSMTIKNSYNTGIISGSSNSGGISGVNNGQINNCYYLENTAENGISNGNGFAVIKSEIEFKNGTVCQLVNYHSYKNDICSLCGKHKNSEPEFPSEEIDTVYQISTAEDLYWFANYVNSGNTSANAVLVNDIIVNADVLDNGTDLNGQDFKEWVPIGTDSLEYEGKFDGQDYTISGLYLDDLEYSTVGLFGVVGTEGTICNLKVKDSYFNANDYVSGLCGLNNGLITNCIYDGFINVTSDSSRVGGICGYNNGIIINCYNISTITVTSVNAEDALIYTGGICGENKEVIKNCYNNGSIIGLSYTAGICGYNTDTILNCSNTGDVSGLSYVGCICGNNKSSVENCYYLENSADSGIGYGSGSAISKPEIDFSNGTICGLLNNHMYENDVCIMCGKQQSSEPPSISENIGVVYQISTAEELYWFANYVNNGNVSANAVLTNDIIVNLDVLDDEGNLNNGKFEEWTPIGAYPMNYIGTFDGQNHTISGLYVDSNSNKIQSGLFGCIGNDGKVFNTGIIDSYFEGTSSTGGICGNSSGNITNCYNLGTVHATNESTEKELFYFGGICGDNSGIIKSCYGSGIMSITNDFREASVLLYIGGICGNNSGTIENCYNTNSIYFEGSQYNSDYSGSLIGGICGYNTLGIISNCYNTGTINATIIGSKIVLYIGGVCGINGLLDDGGAIENCYNSASLNGSSYILANGGVCALNEGSIVNSYNTGNINGESDDSLSLSGICSDNSGDIRNCYNYGIVAALNNDYQNLIIGSVCGNNNDSISNCYYLEGTAVENNSSATSKTSAQFESGEVAFLLENGNSSETSVNVWGQKIDTDKFPVINGDKVYQNERYEGCIGNPGEIVSYYSNEEKTIEYGEHNYSQGGICKDCNALENGKDGFKSASITLTDGVIINYYVLLSDEALKDSGAYIHFTSPQGLNKQIQLSSGVKDNERYKFSLELRPDQMSDEITAQVVYSDGSKGNSVVYSVKQYADKVDDTDASKALVDAMLNYGAFSQLYTGENTDNLVTDVTDYTENAVIGEEFAHKIYSNIPGVTVKSATLQLGADVTIKVKYQLPEGADVNDYTFKCDGAVMKVERSGDYYYVYLKHISPQNFDKMHTFTVSDGENTTTLEYSAFSYMKNILDNSEYYNKNIVNLMNSMYDYNKVAKAYKG